MSFLGPADLDNIKKYKYHPGVYTPLDNVLSHFWAWIVELLPKTLAPNMITLIGLIFSVSSCLIYAFYCPTFTERAPLWVYVYGAVACFLFQTLDAVDGKQARRTNSSSPLGQMFDHGCDSFNTGFQCMAMCAAMGLGPSFYNLIMFASSTCVFYICQLMEYSNGVLVTSDGYFGVTELQYIIMAIHLVAGFFGPNVFFIPLITIYGIKIHFVFLQAFGLIVVSTGYVIQCYKTLYVDASPLTNEEIGNKNLSPLYNTLRCIPFITFTCLAVYLTVYPGAIVYQTHPFLIYCIIYIYIIFSYLSYYLYSNSFFYLFININKVNCTTYG